MAVNPAATVQELTDQAVAAYNRILSLEAEVARQGAELAAMKAAAASGGGGRADSNNGVLDKKKLYPREFRKGSSFRRWAERVIKWIALERQDIADLFESAAKSETKVDMVRITLLCVQQLCAEGPRP